MSSVVGLVFVRRSVHVCGVSGLRSSRFVGHSLESEASREVERRDWAASDESIAFKAGSGKGRRESFSCKGGFVVVV